MIITYNKAQEEFNRWKENNSSDPEVLEYIQATLDSLSKKDFILAHRLAMTAGALDEHLSGKPTNLSKFCLITLRAMLQKNVN